MENKIKNLLCKIFIKMIIAEENFQYKVFDIHSDRRKLFTVRMIVRFFPFLLDFVPGEK